MISVYNQLSASGFSTEFLSVETMRIKPQIDQTVIVLEGSFNPAIFQPVWFARHGMLGEREAENPDISQTNQELMFKAGTLEIHVVRDRFSVASLDNNSGHVKDLVISCFREFLPHTPILSVRIRRYIHFDARTSQAVDHVRSLLAPLEPWGQWGDEIKSLQKPLEKRYGMLAVVVGQQLQSNREAINVIARVEPSLRISSGTGLFIEVENFLQFTGNEQTIQDASLGVRVLEDNWESSLKRAEGIFDQIMKLTQ